MALVGGDGRVLSLETFGIDVVVLFERMQLVAPRQQGTAVARDGIADVAVRAMVSLTVVFVLNIVVGVVAANRAAYGPFEDSVAPGNDADCAPVQMVETVAVPIKAAP